MSTCASSVWRIRFDLLASGAVVIKISRFYADGKSRSKYHHHVTPSSLRRILLLVPRFVAKTDSELTVY